MSEPTGRVEIEVPESDTMYRYYETLENGSEFIFSLPAGEDPDRTVRALRALADAMEARR